MIQTVSFETQAERDAPGPGRPKLDLSIPPVIPGSEAPRVVLHGEGPALDQQVELHYPELPPLPVEPQPQPGPGDKPYTLADFQRLAAANSPALRQAAADVEAAKGILIQSRTYPNPTLGYLQDPSNNNSVAGVQGAFVDQPIVMGGKLKVAGAAAQKDLDNATLALKRARSDLSTAVRNAYFALLVDKETLIVTRALAHFTDDIYGLQKGLLHGAVAAHYEPASLRAQAFSTRLAYKQAIATYIYDWKQLVATMGLPQLPLSEVSGQVDRYIPYFDYDAVLAYALQNHTDILAAQNAVQKARYNVKSAQLIPAFPDLDVRMALERDMVLAPFGTYAALQVGVALPVWDQNKGNIIAAQSALVRASEESHRVAVTLTNNLANAYTNYRNNLYAMEYYRRYILPDLVRYYRGVFARRQLDPTSAFGDLVFAQQNLSSNVTAYLGVLGSLWTSVGGVADFLQTDDLFRMASPRALPDAPDLSQLSQWVCGHDAVPGACAPQGVPTAPLPFNPRPGMSPAQRTDTTPASPSRDPSATHTSPAPRGVISPAPAINGAPGSLQRDGVPANRKRPASGESESIRLLMPPLEDPPAPGPAPAPANESRSDGRLALERILDPIVGLAALVK
jgi:cobalt-zinc-cadmium efflux system outer membrane protein